MHEGNWFRRTFLPPPYNLDKEGRAEVRKIWGSWEAIQTEMETFSSPYDTEMMAYEEVSGNDSMAAWFRFGVVVLVPLWVGVIWFLAVVI